MFTKEFRELNPDEIECRVVQIKADGLSILLYKKANTDADILDETVGPENWSNDFKAIDGVLYGGIGVDFGNGFIWKWDAGSDTTYGGKDKGRASDAFKKAGFKHGIGRELYSAPNIFIPASSLKKLRKAETGHYVCPEKFSVAFISCDGKGHIDGLTITNDSGEAVYRFGCQEPIYCEDCGERICEASLRDGKKLTDWQIAKMGLDRYGRALCVKCGTKADAEAEAAAELSGGDHAD